MIVEMQSHISKLASQIKALSSLALFKNKFHSDKNSDQMTRI